MADTHEARQRAALTDYEWSRYEMLRSAERDGRILTARGHERKLLEADSYLIADYGARLLSLAAENAALRDKVAAVHALADEYQRRHLHHLAAAVREAVIASSEESGDVRATTASSTAAPNELQASANPCSSSASSSAPTEGGET